jgi:hypothetical protein
MGITASCLRPLSNVFVLTILGIFMSKVYSQTCTYGDLTGTCTPGDTVGCGYFITNLCPSPNVGSYELFGTNGDSFVVSRRHVHMSSQMVHLHQAYVWYRAVYKLLRILVSRASQRIVQSSLVVSRDVLIDGK